MYTNREAPVPTSAEIDHKDYFITDLVRIIVLRSGTCAFLAKRGRHMHVWAEENDL